MVGAQPIRIQEVQAAWLKEWHKYMICTYAPECIDALEVGCGTGFVMRNLHELLRIKGIDIEKEQVSSAKAKGMDVEFGDGHQIDHANSTFDLVYCSFFLMWVDDPGKVLDEMIRVAKRRVIILSEPVWRKTLHSPPELRELVEKEIDSIREQGGDPDFGLSLVKLLKKRGLKYRYGTVPMDTSSEETRLWVDIEREYVATQGKEMGSVEVELFHVPFIWAVIDLS